MVADKDQPMPENEHTALRQFLRNKGLTPQQIQNAVGNGANGRKRGEVEQALTTFLKTLPKGS